MEIFMLKLKGDLTTGTLMTNKQNSLITDAAINGTSPQISSQTANQIRAHSQKVGLSFQNSLTAWS